MKKILFLTIWLIGLVTLVQAQQYPVQVSPQLIPPYSLQVSEYYSPTGTEKLRVLLLNRDLQQPQVNVRLRLVIESQSVRIRTREDVSFPTIPLVSGTPYYVTPQDLAPYFNANNLEFSGISREQYEQTGKLPEGLYSFCFEAVEVATGLTVSTRGCAYGWMTLSEPPFLNLPRKGESVAPTTPQNLIFNWTPRHTSAPNTAYNMAYEFSIVELLEESMSPEAAFLSNPVLFTDEVVTTTYLYDATKPQLLPGKKYAWRVRAVMKYGAEDVGAFRNGGITETYWFTYQNTCLAPMGISATGEGQRTTIQWQSNPEHLDYKVEYREKNNAEAQWFTLGNTQPRVSLSDLKPSQQYEYRVGAACQAGLYNYSPLLSFTTNGASVSNVEACGDTTQLTDPNGQSLLATLESGDSIYAGDFTVITTQVSGSGSFTGEGYVKVPWLANMNLGVRFTNITLDMDKKLVSGVIQTTYDPTESGIADVDSYVDAFIGGNEVGHVVTGLDTADHVVNMLIQMPGGIVASFGTGYDPATGTGPVTLTLTPSGGGTAQTIVVDHLPTTIKDIGGNIYQVNKDGTVTTVGKSGGNELLVKTNRGYIDVDKAVVHFVDYPEKQVYAFDEWKPAYVKSGTFNKKYERLNNDYYVSAKAIAPGKTDYLKAVVTLKDTTINPDNIQFVNGKGTIYTSTRLSKGIYEIAVVGGPESDAQEIFALYRQAGGKTLNLGKVLVASYPQQSRKVVLVPVNGAPVPYTEIQQKLQDVYGKLNISWQVEQDANFDNTSWDVDKDGKLKVDGTGAFSVQTEEMKDLSTAYRTDRSVDDKTIYLFVLAQAATSIDGASVFGDMPRGNQFGYLFTSGATDETVANTAVHEVGHGLFKLKHLFEYGFAPGTAELNNAMDYPSGSRLAKYQWDILHDPGVVFSLFDSDEAGLFYQVRGIPKNWRNSDGTVNFLTPAKKIVRLPKSLTRAGFTFGIGEYPTFPLMPAGLLSAFTLVEGKDSVAYHAYFDANFKFLGYRNAQGQVPIYLAKDANVEGGTAVMLLPVSNGFKSYRLEGLTYPYHTQNGVAENVIDLKNVKSAQLDASSWLSLYDFTFQNAQVEFGISSTKINPQYSGLMSYMDEAEKNGQYLLVSKIMEYRTVYPDIYDRMTVSFNNWSRVGVWTTTLFNDFINASDPIGTILSKDPHMITAGYFDYLVRKNEWYTKSKEEILVLFIQEFENMIKRQQELHGATISLIKSSGNCDGSPTYFGSGSVTPDAIMGAVGAMSVDELKSLCPLVRAQLVALVLESTIVSDAYEKAIYKLMWTTPEGESSAQFLYNLSSIKDRSGKNILGTLVKAVDDETVFMGSNYNTMIMNFILKAYGDLMKSNHSFTQSNIQPYTGITLSNIANLSPGMVEGLKNRIVSYNYVSFTKRLFKEVLGSLCGTCKIFIPSDTKSVASYNDGNGQVSFKNKSVVGFVTVSDTSAVNYSALDPIILDDKSKLLDVYESTGGYYVPAIMLYFLEEKANARTTVEAIQTTFDVASLAIPGGQATLALKLLNYADKASAVSSLVATLASDSFPNFSKVMNITSGVLGLANATGSFAVNDYNKLNDLHSSMQVLSKSDNMISAEDHIQKVEALCAELDKLGDATKSPSQELLDVMSSPIGMDKEFLVKILEMEKKAAAASGRAILAEKLEKAISKVNNYSGGVKVLKTARAQTMFDRLTQRFNFFTKSSDKYFTGTTETGIIQVAHLEAGELVLDKVDELSSLSTSAHLVDHINDAEFFRAGNTNITTGDILFFEDGGVIKCISGNNCFTGNTLVQTRSGFKTIQTITSEDTVLSYNEATKKQSWQRVTQVFRKGVQNLQRLIAGRDTIYTTADHLFYTGSRWVKAAALTAGMSIQCATGFATLSDNVSLDSSATVYNFTVEHTHTYYVGAKKILVHNDCDRLAAIITSLGDKGKEFINDFKSNQEIINKFINGQIDVSAWELLKLRAPELATDAEWLTSITKWSRSEENFISDLQNVEVFAAYKAIRTNPEQAWNIIEELTEKGVISDAFEKYARSKFFRDILQKGRDFEIAMGKLVDGFDVTMMSELESALGLASGELNGYKVVSQLQINLQDQGGGFFIADRVLIREIINADDEIERLAYILEMKLSDGTSLTDPQNAFKEIYNNGNGKTTFTTRNIDNNGIEQGTTLSIKGAKRINGPAESYTIGEFK